MSRNHSRINRLLGGLLVGLLGAGLSVSALAQSVPFPTYSPGENTGATTGPTYAHPLPQPWVVSDGTIITPAGTQVYLGTTTRAKALALNPNTSTHTAAVLIMGLTPSSTGSGAAIEIFNTQTGAVLQSYNPPYLSGTSVKYDTDGSGKGIAYTPDGLHLLFSQDGNYGPKSYVTIASVSPTTGLITSTGGANPYPTQVSLPLDINSGGYLTTVECFPNSPGGTTGSILIPCGETYSVVSDGTYTSYPLGIAISPDNKTAYVVLDNNDTLTKIDLGGAPPTEGEEIRVGNVPNSVVISPDGRTAYVSNEAGRVAKEKDFQEYSNGTPVVADNPTGSTSTGTVSVVDLASFTVTHTIDTDIHPTGMAFWGKYLLVAHPYSDKISVIDTTSNTVARTIDLGLPIGVPGESNPAFGAGPTSIAVDAADNLAYVALYHANAVAVVDLNTSMGSPFPWGAWGPFPNPGSPIIGMIPVGYAPSSIMFDATDNELIVSNDKGLGTTGFAVNFPPCKVSTNPPDYGCSASETNNSPENSYQSSHGVADFGTHQDLGTVSIVPVPDRGALWAMTQRVFLNNHWDLFENIWAASGGDSHAKPVAIPARIGDPSLIKHVFVIIRENRTYDQILGDVSGGNGQPALAVFGDAASYGFMGGVTPNAHTLVQRFPLLDNFYDPSRQSADGHNWIVQAMAPYSDDIQSPDWLRDYPSNGGDSLAYQKKGHLWDQAAKAGVSFKDYGEYIEYNTFNPPPFTPPTVCSKPAGAPSNACEPTWTDFYYDTQSYENGLEPQLYNYNTVASHSPLPNLINNTYQRYPQFDLGIPDQFRFDIWNEDFQKDVSKGTVPQLEFMWISSDHTGGPPTVQAMQADNDLALGRFVEAISKSSVWKDSVIFVEEDDAQDGVDHVDGHRSPGYVISPYVVQKANPDGTGGGVTEESTFYTQVNMTRTIEQILGLTPMNQFDLVASPMRTLFVDEPPANNFKPWTHVPNQVPLIDGVNFTTNPLNQPIPGEMVASVSKQPQTVANESRSVKALRAGWLKLKEEMFAGKYQKPDSEDVDTVTHYNWYEATGFKVPFPGEKKVRPASDFKRQARVTKKDDDDDDDGDGI